MTPCAFCVYLRFFVTGLMDSFEASTLGPKLSLGEGIKGGVKPPPGKKEQGRVS